MNKSSEARTEPKQSVIPPGIYTKEYYLTDNEGCLEYARLDELMHDKFVRALRLAQIQPGDKILDIGCGRAELVYYSIKQGAAKALGIDYSPDAIEIAKQTIRKLPESDQNKVQVAVGTAEDYPFPDKYDIIFFIEITEHMHDWQLKAAFRKFNDILTDKGRIIIMTPNFLYEKYLQPMKKILNIPGRLFKWPLRILRGKYKPKNLKEVLDRIFNITTDRGERNRKMHCNVITPGHMRALLKDFTVDLHCEDHSINPLSLLLGKWLGREIVAVARKKRQ